MDTCRLPQRMHFMRLSRRETGKSPPTGPDKCLKIKIDLGNAAADRFETLATAGAAIDLSLPAKVVSLADRFDHEKRMRTKSYASSH